MRVLRIIDRLNIGGPAKHVTWLTAGLDPGVFQTTLVTGTVPEGEGDMTYFAREAGIEPVVIREMSRELSPRDLVVIARLVRLMWRIKPDVVHTHKSKAGAAGRTAAFIYRWLTPSSLLLRPRKCLVFHTFHGHIFHGYYGKAKTRLFVTIERILSRFTDRIIVISEQQRHEICEQFRVGRPGQFRVIPLGIDLNEGSSQPVSLRSELGIDEDETVVGIVGRLCEVKNHRMFLEAAARFRSGNPAGRVRFVIVGDGHLRSDLEAQARALGISDTVRFTGFRKDASRIYDAFDIVALTSINEGTPLTLIEAMSRSRPVVATEAGGVVDIMGARWTDNGNRPRGTAAEEYPFGIFEHGLMCRREDPEAFASALRFLVESPELRRRMGERGRRFVTDCLSRERLIRDVEALYTGE